MADTTAEGWYQDPFGIHEFRWFSDGTPTGLVRDGQVESTDAPPEGEAPGILVPEAIAPDANADGVDLLRADSSGPSDAAREADGPWDTMPEAFPVD